MLQIASLSRECGSGQSWRFFILFECWLQSGHGLLLFLFITSLLRWDRLIWLLLSATWVKAIFWMHSSFHVELPSCHSLLMSLVLFQENITSSHRCLTDCKSLNNVRLYSLSVNLKWQRTIRNKNNTFFIAYENVWTTATVKWKASESSTLIRGSMFWLMGKCCSK